MNDISQQPKSSINDSDSIIDNDENVITTKISGDNVDSINNATIDVLNVPLTQLVPESIMLSKEEYQTEVIEQCVKKLNQFNATLKQQAQDQVQLFLEESKAATQSMIENWKKREEYRVEVVELHKRATVTTK